MAQGKDWTMDQNEFESRHISVGCERPRTSWDTISNEFERVFEFLPYGLRAS